MNKLLLNVMFKRRITQIILEQNMLGCIHKLTNRSMSANEILKRASFFFYVDTLAINRL
jgi:hypothetical protein